MAADIEAFGLGNMLEVEVEPAHELMGKTVLEFVNVVP